MIIMMLVLIALIFGCIVVYYRWRKLQSYNQSPLNIETFDGLNSPFHPSVLYFQDGWNGWKYWMVETPFSPKCKPYVDRNECPSIHVSNDGVNWTVPTGLINPVVNFGSEGEINLDYYSDPHLVMVGDKMECWYRLTERHGIVDNRDKVSLRKICSNDGVHWSKEAIVSRLWENVADIGLGRMVVSPALVYSPERGYIMWFVDSEDHYGQRKIRMSKSFNGENWTDAIICSLDKDFNAWHIDVQKILDGSFLMTMYDKNDLTLWRSCDGLHWSHVASLLAPSKVTGSFYSNGLYRSCVICEKAQYKLFFSAFDSNKTYIGLAKFKLPGDSIEFLAERNFLTFPQFVLNLVNNEKRRIFFVLKHWTKTVKNWK